MKGVNIPGLDRVHQGDVLDVLRSWPDGFVQTVVTSPPYYGLRDYDLPPSVWGGSESCAHDFKKIITAASNGCVKDNVIEGKNIHSATKRPRTSGLCQKCGAWKGCLGNEPTPEMYVDNLVAVFREIHRVLRPDGTVWLNLGDSYAANRSYQVHNTKSAKDHTYKKGSRGPTGMKPKDLMGMPWMTAFALRADGWYLRSEIIWDKPNPMPESAEDRPTRSHEQVFLLSKQEKYYYDYEAVKEKSTHAHEAAWDNGENGHGGGVSHAGQGSSTRKFASDPGRRNLRSVWKIATRSFKDAHFATFPEKLIVNPIQAGTSAAGCCSDCRAPLRRIIEKPDMADRPLRKEAKLKGKRIHTGFNDYPQSAGQAWQAWRDANPNRTVGWEPTCACFPGLKPGDLDIIQSPTGKTEVEDPSIFIGRAGMSRPRNEGGGRRPITRWEQRDIAAQIKFSDHRPAMNKQGGKAFDHYVRTDLAGARPVPAELLESWVKKGWIVRNQPPAPRDLKTIPCIVLDPFSGAGTSWLVSSKLGRSYLGIELGKQNIEITDRRMAPELNQGRLL